jgi:hypothetical protein
MCGRLSFGLLLLTFLALAPAGAPRADVAHLSDGRAVSGTVLALDRDTIVFTEGCGAHETRLSWQLVSRLELGAACNSPPSKSHQAIVNTCEVDSFRVFVVEFRNGNSRLIAESIAITRNRIIHLDMLDPWDQAHGSSEDVQQIAKVYVCRSAVKVEVGLPPGFCSEPRQVAVAFDYKAPLSNKILTNGFSFYIRLSGNKPDTFDLNSFRKEVRSGFQHAVSVWTSALQDRKHLLTADIARFIESRISRSQNGYILLTPPQVIELACPHAATFIVDLSFDDRALFPRPPLVLAKAQTEGRTIALNVLDIWCFRSEWRFDEKNQLPFELSDRCLNLIPIMTHELGHAFGIAHIDDPRAHAIMDSRFSRDALVPTERDVIEFVSVLSRTISGGAPGEIAMVSSSGVQPPEDYVECPAVNTGIPGIGCK